MEKHIPNEKELTDWLKELPQDPHIGMEVPEGYFDNLPDQLLSKINTRKKPERKSILRYLPLGAIAAAILLILWLRPVKTANLADTNIDLFAEISYLLENEYDLTTDQMAFLAEDVLSIDMESYLDLNQPEELEKVLEEVAEGLDENYSQLF